MSSLTPVPAHGVFRPLAFSLVLLEETFSCYSLDAEWVPLRMVADLTLHTQVFVLGMPALE